MKKIVSLIVTVILAVSCLGVGTINASALSSVISFSKNNISVGDTVTVTVTISADEKMYSYGMSLEYDPSILEVQLDEATQSGGAGVVMAASGINAQKTSVTFKFKAIKAGSCYIKTADMSYGNYDYEDVSVPNQGATLTVKDVSLSNNANLKSLTVSEGKLSPAFSASKTSYTVTVDREVTDCKIYATAEDSGASVAVDGGSDLKIGENTCTVTVTAASGEQKVYTVVITRTEETTSSDESSSQEEEEPGETNPLDAEIDGMLYTVAQNIDTVQLPLGFTASKVLYNDIEVPVITDEKGNYTIYFLTTADSTEIAPYTLNTETNTFEKLPYIFQGGRYYIITDAPDSNFDGYYTTNSEIAGFNVKCYASTTAELSAFSYIYCFNGEDYGYYRYDSSEDVIQRYPEMKLAVSAAAKADDGESFSKKFASLETNAKIIILGLVILILCVLALAVLGIARIVNHRRNAEYATNRNYADEFDHVDYDNKFSVESGGFVAPDSEEEALNDLDFGDEEINTPGYLVDEDTEPAIEEPQDDVESDYLTDESEEETEE